jgi:hypothetical protein
MPLKLPDLARHSCAVLSINDSNPWIEHLVMQGELPGPSAAGAQAEPAFERFVEMTAEPGSKAGR